MEFLEKWFLRIIFKDMCWISEEVLEEVVWEYFLLVKLKVIRCLFRIVYFWLIRYIGEGDCRLSFLSLLVKMFLLFRVVFFKVILDILLEVGFV